MRAGGAVLIAGVIAYGVGWHTGIGRLLRGVSAVTINNESETPLRNVEVHLGFGDFGGMTSRFHTIKPHERVRVAADKGDVYVWRVSFDQGKNTITNEIPASTKVGNILEMVVNSSGKISYAH